MAARHTGMETIEVPDQGHVPLLEGDNMLQHVTDFVAKCDGTLR